MTGEREPPSNEPAEMALLGAILHSNKAYALVSDFLRSEHFAVRIHGRIFASCAALIDAGRLADPLTLRGLYGEDDGLAEVGGFSYIMQLAGSVVTVVGAGDYGRAILEAFQRREMIAIAADLAAAAWDEAAPESPVEIADKFDQALAAIGESDSDRNTAVPISRAADDAMEDIERALRHEKAAMGIPTGLRDLDRVLHGWMPGDYVTVAGDTGIGKTGLVTTCALRALRDGESILWFGYEMNARRMARRFLSQMSGVSTDRMKSGQLSGDDLDRIRAAQAELRDLPLEIVDTGGRTLPEIRAHARRAKRRWGRLAITVVDHIGFTSSDKKPKANKTEDVDLVTHGLKDLAVALDTTVIGLSQLNRVPSNIAQESKKPSRSRLRNSGSIEQDSDVILFVFRQEYYLDREEPVQGAKETPMAFMGRQADYQTLHAASKGRGEIIIDKNRDGPCVTVNVAYVAECARWADLYQPHLHAPGPDELI